MSRVFPKNLLCELTRKRRLARCLDYDGTIAPIASSPEEALPPPEIRDLMLALSQHPERLSLTVASGRRVIEVHALLALERPLAIIGTHGLEVLDWDGRLCLTSPIAHCLPAIDKTRDLRFIR
jgi:trehalose-phosphatase